MDNSGSLVWTCLLIEEQGNKIINCHKTGLATLAQNRFQALTMGKSLETCTEASWSRLPIKRKWKQVDKQW